MTSSWQTLFYALESHARCRSHCAAMSDGTTALDWGELTERVMRLAAGGLPGDRVLGIYGANGCDWAAVFLAGLLSGKTLVPLPSFFSDTQIAHIAREAGVTAIVTTMAAGRLPEIGSVSVYNAGDLDHRSRWQVGRPERAGAVIVFTSGSTGQPKGARLSLANLLATSRALVGAVEITPRDSYLSVLPLPMLLEQIAAVLIPVLVGARVHFATEASERLAQGQEADLLGAIAQAAPSVTILVPHLLNALTRQLQERGTRAPRSLRFVAVGGAAAPAHLMAAAAKLGLPVFEGYGLTECGSVVALNTPKCNRPGTAGHPLPGTAVSIVDGEIVVSGPAVMSGYLNAPDLPTGRWRTGDVGRFDGDGYLIIDGRRDNLIVRTNGRNVSPEWIESEVQAMPGVVAAVIVSTGHGTGLGGLIVADWPVGERKDHIAALRTLLAHRIPLYARPETFRCLTTVEAEASGLLQGLQLDRKRARVYFPDLRTQEHSQGAIHEPQ
jgi:long-subunit acyl-CoA synthetase (AMP-forming)